MKVGQLLDWIGLAPWRELAGAPDVDGTRLRALRWFRGVLWFVVGVVAGFLVVGTTIMLEFRTVAAVLDATFGLALLGAAGTLGVTWVVQVYRVVRSRPERSPAPKRRGARHPGPRPVAAAVVLQMGFAGFVGLLAVSRVHSTPTVERPPVRLLYDAQSAPRPIYDVGFAALLVASRWRFGPGHAEVAPLTLDALYEAREQAQFVVVASHGCEGGLFVQGECVPAVGFPPSPDRVGFAYLAGCETGMDRAGWAREFADRVVAYPRNTAVIEHVFWMWTRGPRQVLEMPGPSPLVAAGS